MEELNEIVSVQKSPVEFIKEAWELSEQDHSARCYLFGLLDALRFADLINQETYSYWYEFCS